MISDFCKKIISLAFTALSSCTLVKEDKTKVFLIGDSTMSVKDESAFPETGWGMPFADFFNSTVIVKNHAHNGRSTRTFLSKNEWEPIYNELDRGDYVFIQFGHNDELKNEKGTTTEEFRKNLLKFVQETQKKNAVPVLLTPVSRRFFDEQGRIIDTHGEYSKVIRTLAKEQNISLIDLDKKTQVLYQELGEVKSRSLFLWLSPGQHPNYPMGKKDDIHFDESGALAVAQMVLDEIKRLQPGLAKNIVSPDN